MSKVKTFLCIVGEEEIQQKLYGAVTQLSANNLTYIYYCLQWKCITDLQFQYISVWVKCISKGTLPKGFGGNAAYMTCYTRLEKSS